MSDEAKDGVESRNAGRGGVFVLGAKVFFILVGFVQQSLLERVLGLSDYGALARVLAPANIVNNVVVQGSIQGVSRRVAPAREAWPRELAASLRIHIPLAIAIAVAFALLADPIARFQKAPHIVLPLRVVALVALAYGIYAPLVGAINGRQRFGRQAALDVTFATLRTIGLVGLGWVFVTKGFGGVVGATAGFAIAAVMILPLGAVLAWRGAGATRTSTNTIASAGTSTSTSTSGGAYLVGLAGVALAQGLVNLLMQADLMLVGRFLSEGALNEARRADEWVGVYRACQLFAFLPYQLVLSVAQVLFPMVARAHAEGDTERVRAVVARGMRIAAIMGGALVAVVATLPGTLLRFTYSAEIASRGVETLRILSIGQGAFALFGVSSMVLVSLGRERISIALSGAALVLVTISCFGLVSGAPFGAAQIERAAFATSLGLFFALALAATMLRRSAGAFAPAKTLVRVVIAIGLLATAGAFVPTLPRLLAPIAAAATFVIYLVVLAVMGELGRDDARAIRALARR